MLPDYLARDEAQGLLREGQPVAQFELGDYKNFVYLVIDWSARAAAMIDTRAEWEPIRDALQRHSLRLERILLTHSHHDHVPGLPVLLKEFPEIPVHAHPLEFSRLDASKVRLPRERLTEIREGEMLSVGRLRLQAHHTPGHSPGEISYRLEARDGQPQFLFTGDTLFIRDCGRTDLPGGSNEQMFSSLRWIASLDPDTVILPGHHYARETAAVLHRELAESAPLRCGSAEELALLP